VVADRRHNASGKCPPTNHVGLEVDGRPLVRAYSMCSAHHEENLEFLLETGFCAVAECAKRLAGSSAAAIAP